MNDKLLEHYKKYPDLFIEDFLDVKLNGFQKIYLRMMNTINREDEDMKLKYGVGETVRFISGTEANIVSIKIGNDNKVVYVVSMRDRCGLQDFDADLFEKQTFSREEWDDFVSRNWKFKVGDVLEIHNERFRVIGIKNAYKLEDLNSSAVYEGSKDYVEHIATKLYHVEYSEIWGRDVMRFEVEQVKPKQYIPSKNESYFYVDLADENLFGVATWVNDSTDYHMLKLGLIKQTPQECVKLAKEMLKKLELEV